MMKYFFQTIAFLFISPIIFAQVKLASPFGDHMVLQQNALVPVWGTATAGEKVTVAFGKQKKTTTTGADGKWMIKLDKLKSGGPFELSVTGKNTLIVKDVYVGEVWLCSGQSNMDMTVAREDRYWCGVHHEAQELATANYPLIRVFDTDFTPSDVILNAVGGKWEITSPETVGHFSAAAYFFARELYHKYKVPVGLITTAYGASTAEAWTSKKALEADPLFAKLLSDYEKKKAVYDTSIVAKQKYIDAYAKWQTDAAAAKIGKKDPPRGPKNPDPKVDQHSPYVLYNGMVAPLIPYAIKGAIWYQGESNTTTKDIYAKQMEALINNWRTDFAQGDFPFIYVQLANYGKTLDTIPGKGGGTTVVRDQQLKNLAVKNTAMVVAIDNADDPSNIHPKNKQQIGLRLALAAEAKVYGEQNVYSGPLFSNMTIEGNTIRLNFNYADGGLIVKGDKPIGFAIAGKDKKFVWAVASIDGSSIVVSSPGIAEPVAVRYAWGDNPPANVYNKADLPASPFKTDDW
ncbi:sialate O-acetylesterase family protein [Ferruginibacter profundus]